MNSKFFVSLEAARLLKEKGYNEECDYCFYYDDYNDEWDFDYPHHLFDDDPIHYNNETIDDEMYSMPSLLEAMDWLEERGIFISVEYFGGNEWKYFIYSSKYLEDNYETDDVFYTDRYECMNAAVKKGGELL